MNLNALRATGPNNPGKQVSVDRWNNALTAIENAAADVINVKAYGAAGDGSTDDTAALALAFSALNDAGGGTLYFPEGTYLHGNIATSSLPTSTWKTSLQALIADGGYQFNNIGLPLVGLRGAKVTGDKGAILKRKDDSCNANAGTDVFGWAQIFLYDCTDVEICGFQMDGNRAGQTHTSAIVSAANNHNIEIFPAYLSAAMVPVDRVQIHHMRFTGSGTLITGAGDKKGDAFYIKLGCNDVRISENQFDNWGRWAIAVENGYPNASFPGSSNGIYIENNVFRAGFKEDGAVHIGSIDVEPSEEHHNIKIRNNQFFGSCKVSFGSVPTVDLHQVCYGNEIVGNTWDLRGQVSATVSSDTIINIGATSGWGTVTSSSVGKSRRMVGFRVENNGYVSDGQLDHFIHAVNAILDGFICRNNNVVVPDTVTNGQDLIRFTGISLRGRCEVSDNRANNKVIGINVVSFQQDFENKIFDLAIDGNTLMGTTAGIRFTGPTFMIGSTGTAATTSGSKTITGTGTLFRKELRVGGKITHSGSSETLTIASIASDTSATATANAANTASTAAFTRSPGAVLLDGNTVTSQTSASGTIIAANNAVVTWGRRNSIAGVVTLTGVRTPDLPSASWTPTLSADSGTFTTIATTTARYAKINGIVTGELVIQITDKGTAAGAIKFTPPVTPANSPAAVGYNTASGAALIGSYASGAFRCLLYNGSDPIADSSFYVFSFQYEAA